MENTTVVAPFNFVESIENLPTENKYNYLLNFWYTAKLNKELEYVKRHGIHPTLEFFDNDLANSFGITNGADISTAFYTVFRIYLEKAFPGFKFKKERNIEKWDASFEGEDDFPLDNPTYLKIFFANENGFNTTNQIIRLSGNYRTHFNIRINYLNSLYVKSVNSDFSDINDYCVREVDAKLPDACNRLFNKLALGYLDLPIDPEAKPVKKAVKRSSTTSTVAPRPISQTASSDDFVGLIELYNSMARSMPAGFNERTKFSFLVTYANSSGLPTVVDNESNYNTFTRLRTAETRRAA